MPAPVVVDHPIVAHALGILRDKTSEPARFRDALGQIAMALLIEATRDLPLTEVEIETPIARTRARRLAGRLGIVPVLRAGLGFVDPALTLLPGAEIWHLGVFRDERTLEPVTYYNKLHRAAPPDTAIVVDPMLATGGSACAILDLVGEWHPKVVKYVCVIAAPEGIARLRQRHPAVPVFTAAVDERLDERAFIVPGLGDAGDRQFGTEG